MKIFKTALVLTLIGIGCGFLIGISNEITAPVIAENERKAELAAYESLFPGLDNVEESDVELQGLIYQALDVIKGNDTVGRLYKGKANNGYGSVDLLIGIDNDNIITGIEFLNLDQTASMKPAIEENAEYYKGVDIADIDLDDLLIQVSSNNPYDTASGSSFGSTSMRTIIRDAILLHSGTVVITDPYILIYGEEVTKTEEAISADSVTKKEVIKSLTDEVLGTAYTVSSVKNTGSAVEYNEDQDWTMTLLVGLDENNVIVGIKFLTTSHSSGFYDLHNTYFDLLVGTNIADYQDVINTVTGASFSKGHIADLLEALKVALA